MSTLTKSPKATTITIYSLGILLGLLHIFLGVVALTPLVNQDYHREIKINYSAFAKSLLNFYDFGDRASVALYLRSILSAAQIGFGTLLLENGYFGQFGRVGNYGLLVLDSILLCFQLSVGTSYERIAPTIVFSILLVARLIIVEQSSKKVRSGVKTRNAGKPKTSTPKKNKNE